MPRTLESPPPSIPAVAGVKATIQAVARSLEALVVKHSRAKRAAAKAALFRHRRAVLDALYMESHGETGVVNEESRPIAGSRSER